jgi:hypothetical protein
VGGIELPIGLTLITVALFTLATINVLTKKVATISGLSFTVAFFVLFLASEAYNKRRHLSVHKELEKFRLQSEESLSSESLKVRPGNVLVSVRNPKSLKHLEKVLQRTDIRKIDIVVLSIYVLNQKGGEYSLETDQVFNDQQSELFTKVVSLAEAAGKHVELLVVPAKDARMMIMRIAQQLQSARIVAGISGIMSAEEQGRLVGQAWEQLPDPKPSVSLEVVNHEGASRFFNLGPHPPRLWPEDVDRVHRIWLALSPKFGANLHHRDVVGVALRKLEMDLESGDSNPVLDAIQKELEIDHSKDIADTTG